MDHTKYVKGDLLVIDDEIGLRVYCDNDLVCERVVSRSSQNKSKLKATMDLMASAKDLLQIVEMYYDSMQGTKLQGSLPYELTNKILKQLKTR